MEGMEHACGHESPGRTITGADTSVISGMCHEHISDSKSDVGRGSSGKDFHFLLFCRCSVISNIRASLWPPETTAHKTGVGHGSVATSRIHGYTIFNQQGEINPISLSPKGPWNVWRHVSFAKTSICSIMKLAFSGMCQLYVGAGWRPFIVGDFNFLY